MEWTRAILYSQCLPSKLWAEVLNTVWYLYTLGPIRALKNSIPTMIFRNHQNNKPAINHLWILRYTAYTHINKQLHTKLDAKSTKCILVGYGDDCKVYCVWDPKTDKVYHSRDVIFDETQIGFKDIDREKIQLLDTEEDIDNLSIDDNDDSEYDIE